MELVVGCWSSGVMPFSFTHGDDTTHRTVYGPIYSYLLYLVSFPGGAVVNNPSASAGDAREVGSILGSGRSPGEGNGNPLQYSCLENPLDRGAWQDRVHGVAKALAT